MRQLWYSWLLQNNQLRQTQQHIFLHYSHMLAACPPGASQHYQEALEKTLQEIQVCDRPWDAANIRAAGMLDLADQYHEMYGYPGDEKYEKMLQQLDFALASLAKQKELAAAQQQQEQQAYANVMRALKKL